MSLRRRLTLSAAAAVAVAFLLASLLTYFLVRGELRGQIDRTLRARALSARLLEPPLGGGAPPPAPPAVLRPLFNRLPPPRPGELPLVPGRITPLLRPLQVRPGQDRGFAQLVTSLGQVFRLPDSPALLPVTAAVRSLAGRGSGRHYFEAHAAGVHVRVLAEGLPGGQAIETARSLDDVDTVLRRIRLILLALAGGGVALAALLGRFVSGSALAPVRRLTQAAEHVAGTQDLGQRIDAGLRDDELGRLARSFNGMLDVLQGTMAALDESARAQRRLVADASHELRTPVTSLRMNLELLSAQPLMSAAERDALMVDVVAQLEELSLLIADLLELARDEPAGAALAPVRLDELVGEMVSRAQRAAPDGVRFSLSLEPVEISGLAPRLERAVANMLDNAVKFAGASNGLIEVSLSPERLAIRDHGPGVPAADLPHLFERFFRGLHARSLPGSGLGLAIVQQVAELHGFEVGVEQPNDGGMLIFMKLR